MITKDNLKFCFENLNKDEVEKAMDNPFDYILFEIHTFNAGAYATVEAQDYDDEVAQEAADNGQLFIDKDEFLRLFEESKATNQYLEEYI
jgi:hypothetical protein